MLVYRHSLLPSPAPDNHWSASRELPFLRITYTWNRAPVIFWLWLLSLLMFLRFVQVVARVSSWCNCCCCMVSVFNFSGNSQAVLQSVWTTLHPPSALQESSVFLHVYQTWVLSVCLMTTILEDWWCYSTVVLMCSLLMTVDGDHLTGAYKLFEDLWLKCSNLLPIFGLIGLSPLREL